MTRFELHIGRGDEWYIFNTETNARYISLGEVVDKLNEQQATIRKLQDLCGESDSENAKLRIENKRLEKEVNLLRPTNLEQYEQIQKLQEENEQLRKELKELENNYKDLLYDGGFDE